MLLLPIAQENSTVRRTPWVSFGLIAVNVLVFLFLGIAADERSTAREVHRRWKETALYLLQRPYLQPPSPPSLFEGSGLDEAVAEARGQMPAAAIPSADRQAVEQAELQALADGIQAALHRLPAWRWGYIPAEHRPLTALWYMFLHGGWMHLIGNMLFLFLSGPFIEDRYGRALFAALYFFSGLAAVAVYAVHASGSTTPLVGASGAIAGVMGAFLVRLGAQRIRFLFMPILLLPRLSFRVWLPAYVVLPVWLLQQLWYAHHQDQGAGVAWWAHIGGFAFGAIVAAGLRFASIEEKYIDAGIEREISIVQHPGLEKAIDARIAGDFVTARREIRAVLAAEPQNVDGWNELYEIAVASQNVAEAGSTAQRLLDMLLRKGEKELASRLVDDAMERVGEALPPRFLMSAAAFLEKEGDARTALDMYQQVTERAPQDPAAFRAAFRRGEILRLAGDARNARLAYEQARAHPACVEPWPQTIDKALAQMSASA
jgi:membrane associated rhomboid family serine protease